MPKLVPLFTILSGLTLSYAVWPPTGKLVDLSWPYNNKTIEWPGGEKFGFTKKFGGYREPGRFWYAANDFKTAEHCGTHLDAPYHFNLNGWKVADIPIERLIINGILVNVSKETNGDRNYKLTAGSLIQWEKTHGPIPNNTVILVAFGWASRYGDKEDYLREDSVLSFPGISKEAAEWIVNTGKIVGVGVDTASADQGDNNEAHRALLGRNIYILENVATTQPLPPVFKLIVLPIKLSEGSGGPCRIVAII